MNEVWFLKQVDWLGELVDTEWEVLRERARRFEFAPGETVFEPTPDPRSVYLLESGRVRIYRLSAEGTEATLGLIGPGEVFGELTAFGNYARESFAEAMSRTCVWKIPSDLVRGWVRDRPRLAVEVTRQIGERMKRVEARVESLVFRNVRSRLAKVLLELGEDFGTREDSRLVVELGMSQAQLATLIGATRQSVSSTLAEFRQAGLVEQRGASLALEAEGLRREAGS